MNPPPVHRKHRPELRLVRVGPHKNGNKDQFRCPLCKGRRESPEHRACRRLAYVT